MSDMNNHRCIERAADSDCPICNEYLLNSPRSVMFMQCGHSIHLACFEELKKTSYRCPLCNKSCVNMEYHFRQLDMHILQQPMPPDYADARAVISCNDCCAKSQTAFHWLGLKCAVCRSYNTVQLQLLNMPGEQQEQQGQQPHLTQQGGQQPVALDPALLTEEIRRRNRAARREEARQRRDSNNNHNSNFQGFALLSTSPSSYSPAFLLRLLNRSYPSESDHAGPSSTSSVDVRKPRAASSSSPLTVSNAVIATGMGKTAPETACDTTDDDDDDEADDEDLDMLDLFGARDRDFDRMTGLTSAESAVGFDDDDEDEDDEEEDGESSEEEGNGEGEEDEEDEEDEDDILLLGHR
jgi:tyrosyl-DNA phosphodiesterase 2